MNIGCRVRVEMTIKKGNKKEYIMKTGLIVYVIPAYAIPKKKRIINYYGTKVISPKYARVFGPADTDRICVEYDCGGYGVFPAKGNGRFFIMYKDTKIQTKGE